MPHTSASVPPLLADVTPIDGLARAIQLSVAPVFPQAGLSELFGLLTHRLARSLERGRDLQDQSREAGIASCRRVRRELLVRKRRMDPVMRAIQCCTVTVLLVALVGAVVFVSAVARPDLALMGCRCSSRRCCS